MVVGHAGGDVRDVDAAEDVVPLRAFVRNHLGDLGGGWTDEQV